MERSVERARKKNGPWPLLMSSESACPIIEAMLRAQIAETRRRWAKRVNLWKKGESSQLKTSRVARCLKLARKFKYPILLEWHFRVFYFFPPFLFAPFSSSFSSSVTLRALNVWTELLLRPLYSISPSVSFFIAVTTDRLLYRGIFACVPNRVNYSHKTRFELSQTISRLFQRSHISRLLVGYMAHETFFSPARSGAIVPPVRSCSRRSSILLRISAGKTRTIRIKWM